MRPLIDLRKRPTNVCEVADARGQHRFDALAHPPRHHGRRAAGADRDDDVAAIDNGGKNETGAIEVVHNVDRQAGCPGARRHRHADIACAGAQHRDHAVKVGRERIARGEFDSSAVHSLQVMIAVGREPADARAGRNQEP